MSLVENIRTLCLKKGVSIPKLEKEVGFSKGSIYNWDTNSPSIDKVQKVADYFKVSIDLVLYGFDLTRFEELFRIIMNRRTCEQFSEETGINLEVVEDYAYGVITERPSIELVKKISSSNPYKMIVDDESLYRAAGYTMADEIQTLAAHHDGEDWTEEELEDIEDFKEILRLRRLKRQSEE